MSDDNNYINLVTDAINAYERKELLRFLMLRSQDEIIYIYNNIDSTSETNDIIKSFVSEFIMDRSVLKRKVK